MENFRHWYIKCLTRHFVSRETFWSVEYSDVTQIITEREREQEIYLYAWRNRSTGWLMHNVSTVCFTLVIHLYIFSRCVFFYTGIAIVHYSRPVHATKKDYWNLIYLIPFAKNVSAKNTRTLFKKRIDESMEFSMFSTSDSPRFYYSENNHRSKLCSKELFCPRQINLDPI